MVEVKRQHQKHNHLAQEADDAEKRRDKMCNCVLDLKDQKADLEGAIWHLKQELKSKKEELAQLSQEERVGGLWSKSHASRHPQCSSLRVLQLSQAHPKGRKE